MVIALLLRIFRWCRKRLHRNQPSPPAPTGWALDPDLLSQDLRIHSYGRPTSTISRPAYSSQHDTALNDATTSTATIANA
jgi:hypothetical protein